MPFSDKLRELRKQHKWSQDELGEKVGIHGRHIGKYENGQVMPNSETLIKIGKIFNVSIDYLLLESKEPRPENISDRELLISFEAVGKMDDRDKEIIKSLIDAYVKKRKVESVITG